MGQTLEGVRDAHAIWGSGAAVNTELAPSGDSGESTTDGLTDEDADREAELSDRRESVEDYIDAGTEGKKERKVWVKERV